MKSDLRGLEAESPGSPPVPAIERARVVRWSGGNRARVEPDWLAREEPIEIRVRGRSVAVAMRTPGHDAELAAGFFLSEGLVHQAGDITEMAPCAVGENALWGNVWNVFLAPGIEVDFGQLTRHVLAGTSCGLCGKATIESVHRHFPPVASGLSVEVEMIQELPEKLRQAQSIFRETGGLHAAAVFDRSGALIVLREDVGRHNAVDKAIGFGFLEGLLPFSEHVLLVSGRASFEIMQKALAARVPVVAAVSAPSSLAVDFALESGQVLIGFLRGGRMNVYAHAERVNGLNAGTPE